MMLIIFSALLSAVWLLSNSSLPQLYQFALGCLVLLQSAIHMRHLRNLFLFRSMRLSDAVVGRIEYSRRILLQMSAAEALSFSGLFLLVSVFTESWFVLGGSIACFSLAAKHRKLATRVPSRAATEAQPSQGA
jgi:hypothetical protein